MVYLVVVPTRGTTGVNYLLCVDTDMVLVTLTIDKIEIQF
jgi:hypothetical protein